jgi:hypothetical protein
MSLRRVASSFALALFASVLLSLPARGADAGPADQDVEKLKTWAKTYGDSQLIQEDPAKLAEIVAQAPQVEEEVKRIKAQWEAKPRGDRDASKVSNMLNFFERNWENYTRRIESFKDDGPKQITQHLDEAEKMSDQAVAERKPLFFTGGIPQRMKWAADKLAVLNAVDPAAAKPLQARYDALKPTIPQKEASLRNEIIAANEPPRDNYSGPDKAKLIELAKSSWTEAHPDAQIVAVKIPGNDWKRDTRWTWYPTSRTFEKSDRSKLQAQLLVKSASDPKLLEVHVVDLFKDHLSNDALKAVRWDDKDVPVQNLILAEKVK